MGQPAMFHNPDNSKINMPLVKVIGFYPVEFQTNDTERRTAERYYNALCTTYFCNVQVIDNISEAVIPDGIPIIALEENRGMHINNFVHPREGIYFFGNTDNPFPSELLNKADGVIHIPVPNTSIDWPLYGVSVAAIILNHRFLQQQEKR